MTIKNDNHLVALGETNFRGQRWRFGIKSDDRRRHMYVVGSTGMGKSEFLKNMAIQDIEAGRGIAFIDPHGDSVDDLLDHIPASRIKDVVYFDPGDLEYPIAFNVMEGVEFDYRHLVASGLVGVFKKIWGVEAWSGRMEYILNNTILALLEYPDSTLLGINRLMSNKEYRKKVVSSLRDPIVKSFWVEEFAKYADKFATEATAAIQNKVGQFSSNNLIRNIIGQPHSKIDIRKIMDEGKILLANVSRGKIGEDASRLLGAFLVTKIQLAAMSRVDIAEKDRKDFYLYVDEFQHFATESFANILSEARKFHLSLVMAHQYIKQMEEPVRDAVFGNVGTIVSFRVGAEDAEFLEKWFQPDFMMNDIVNLGKYNVYLKLMIDGVSSRGFSAAMIPPLPSLETSSREAIIENSRNTYATPRSEVEKDIAEWAGQMESQERPRSESSRPTQSRPFSQNDGPRENYTGPRENFRPRYSDTYEPRRPDFQSSERPMRQEFRRDEAPRREEKPLRNYDSPKPTSQPQQPRTIGLEPRKIEPIVVERSVPVSAPRVEPQRPVSAPPSQFQSRPQSSQPIMPSPRPPMASSQSDRPEPRSEPRAERPEVPQPRQGISMQDAFKQGAVNFRGKRIEERSPKPKVEVNSDELKRVLEEAMGSKE